MESGRKLDLALEAREWAAGAGEVPGVRLEEENLYGLSLTRVLVESREGARALGKPEGVPAAVPALNRKQSRAGGRRWASG